MAKTIITVTTIRNQNIYTPPPFPPPRRWVCGLAEYILMITHRFFGVLGLFQRAVAGDGGGDVGDNLGQLSLLTCERLPGLVVGSY